MLEQPTDLYSPMLVLIPALDPLPPILVPVPFCLSEPVLRVYSL